MDLIHANNSTMGFVDVLGYAPTELSLACHCSFSDVRYLMSFCLAVSVW